MNRRSNKTKGGIAISHGGRVMDETSGVTKLALAEYFEAVATPLLRFAANRPLALVRCPDGAGGQCFFQKHLAKGMPSAVHHREHAGEELIYVADAAGLVALAQFNVMEIHGWGSTMNGTDGRVVAIRVERPDQIVMDLDPDVAVPWARVTAAAREVRDRLSELGLAAFVKTTGGKGLHVVAPLLPAADWDAVKSAARAIANELARRKPSEYVAAATKAKAARVGKIFLDYLRNARGATAIVPFSPRARPGATVAMPVAWDDLDRITPHDFNVRSVPSLLESQRIDPWRDFEASRVALSGKPRGRH